VSTNQVKQNFERFIACKTTIDDIYDKLQTIESAQTGWWLGVSVGWWGGRQVVV
jgi:hypothetical protein